MSFISSGEIRYLDTQKVNMTKEQKQELWKLREGLGKLSLNVLYDKLNFWHIYKIKL